MSGGFRRLLGWRETTRSKAFLLAIAIQMLGLSLLLPWLGTKVWIPAFSPIGIIGGGLLFGMAMGWSGGCPAGIWYKAGGGNLSVLLSLVGMVVGYTTLEVGFLKPTRLWLQSIGTYQGLTLTKLTGLSYLALLISLFLLFLLWRAKPSDKSGSWTWRRTGLWVGIVGLLAWYSSSLAQRPFGMAILSGSQDMVGAWFWDKQALMRWDIYFVAGVPIGGFMAAKRGATFRWEGPQGSEVWKRFSGGLLLGSSASIAGGCTVGHGVTGIPLLSVGSILFISFAIFGTWLGEALMNVKRLDS